MSKPSKKDEIHEDFVFRPSNEEEEKKKKQNQEKEDWLTQAILQNRKPTLTYVSLAPSIPIRDCSTVRLPHSVSHAMHADFDGDAFDIQEKRESKE